MTTLLYFAIFSNSPTCAILDVMIKNNSGMPVTHSVLKRELKNFATKQEFNEWGETLSDRINGVENKLTEKIDGIDGKMDGLEGRMDGMETRMDGLEKAIVDAKDEILTKIDGFVKRVSDLDDENAAGSIQINRINSTLVRHDQRIKKLETA